MQMTTNATRIRILFLLLIGLNTIVCGADRCNDSLRMTPLLPVRSGSRWGYMSSSGNMVISYQYFLATRFVAGAALVKDSSGYSVIDRDGQSMIRAERIVHIGGTYYGILLDEEVRVWDSETAEYLAGGYFGVGELGDGLIPVKDAHHKWGYIDTNGRVVIAPSCDNALPFSQGLAAVAIGEKWGLVNKSGLMVVGLQYDWISHFSEGYAAVCVGEEYWFIDRNGNKQFGREFEIADGFAEGLALVKDKVTGHYGYIDVRGNFAVPPAFIAARSFREGRAAVMVGEGRGAYIDRSGKVIVDVKGVKGIWDLGDYVDGFALLKQPDTVYIDQEGNIIRPSHDD